MSIPSIFNKPIYHVEPLIPLVNISDGVKKYEEENGAELTMLVLEYQQRMDKYMRYQHWHFYKDSFKNVTVIVRDEYERPKYIMNADFDDPFLTLIDLYMVDNVLKTKEEV